MTEATPEAIAIIGISCRFPGANTPEQFYDNLLAGVESLTPRRHWYDEAPRPVPAGHRNGETAVGLIDQIGHLDAGYFGLTPREAEVMDPQIRLFLECAAEALQRAGHDGDDPDARIGVYAGVGINTYVLRHVLPNPRVMQGAQVFQAFASNEKDFVATQTSFRLNLRGPSLSIHTACSTSLVAIVQAVESLLSYQCDVALAGASSIKPDPAFGYFLEEGGIGSKDSVCRAFDAAANGTVGGSGTGVVVLKRLREALADGDPIQAIIRGAATNNDGAHKTGYTAPSIEGQSTVVSEALAVAGIQPNDLSFIETHGTGTPVGDPIEIAALHRALGPGPARSIALGAVKTNIGHLDAAAGVAGLIKATLSLQRAHLPPTLHFQTPNPALHLDQTRFHVPTQPTRLERIDGAPLRAGISSFGIGGTNAHVILEEPPEQAPSTVVDPGSTHVLALSAATPPALDQACQDLANHLAQHPEDLANAAWTHQTGRRRLRHRRAIVAANAQAAIQGLQNQDPSQRTLEQRTDAQSLDVAFLLPGQGAQHVRMAQGLYQNESVYRDAFHQCADLFQRHGVQDLRGLVYPEQNQDLEAAAARLAETANTQPALFAVEYALAKQWMHWGIQPKALLGHSLGEIVAATLAGIFDLPSATKLVAARARLMQNTPEGRMMAIQADADDIRSMLGPNASIAAINAPGTCVVSGAPDAVEQLDAQLQSQGIETRPLHVTRAFHSPLVDGILDEFKGVVEGLELHPPTIPVISNHTGLPLTPEQATEPQYWVDHVRATVHYSQGASWLLAQPDLALLEVGPGRTLTSLTQRHVEPGTTRAPIFASLGHPKDQADDQNVIKETLARLWLAGSRLHWPQIHGENKPRRILLPTYPWQKRRYWLPAQDAGIANGQDLHEANNEPAPETDGDATTATIQDVTPHGRPDLPNPYVAPTEPLEHALADIWQSLLGFDTIGIHDDFFDLGGHSLIATRMTSQIRDAFDVDLTLTQLFETRTIHQLAVVVEASLLEKLESMSDDEAARLVNQ